MQDIKCIFGFTLTTFFLYNLLLSSTCLCFSLPTNHYNLQQLNSYAGYTTHFHGIRSFRKYNRLSFFIPQLLQHEGIKQKQNKNQHQHYFQSIRGGGEPEDEKKEKNDTTCTTTESDMASIAFKNIADKHYNEKYNESSADYIEEVFVNHHDPPVPFIEMPPHSEEHHYSTTTPKVGLIFMDNFSPFHGQYLAHQARNAYKVGVVSVLSGYIVKGLTMGTTTKSNTNNQVEDKKNMDRIDRTDIENDTDEKNDKEEEERQRHDYLSMCIPDIGKEKEWALQIPFKIVGIICESDSGLPSAERLGVALGLYPERHDGINRARRDKFKMNESMRQHGLYTIQQKLCSTVEEAIEFAQTVCNITADTDSDTDTKTNADKGNRSMMKMDQNYIIRNLQEPNGMPCVVLKPLRGVASDNVHLCTSLSQVRDAFQKIYQSPIFSSPSNRHPSVLLQEFARGREYAVDIVSKNGEHKVAALWKYDKRAVNGAPFVYHATILVDPTDSEEAIEACTYAVKALDALNLKWGLSHVEVMVNSEENKTCLIEVNCRQHNTDFAPMTTICIGYNALDMLLAAYLGEYIKNETDHDDHNSLLDWDTVPSLPLTRFHGAIIHLVSFVEGTVQQIKGLEELESLQSVRNYEIYPSFMEGNYVSKTVDIRTDAGWVHLMNDNVEEFWSDYHRIMNLMEDMFVVE